MIERDGTQLAEPEFEILTGTAAVESEPDRGTVSRGAALSPWDGLVIDGDYIKSEAQVGRMGSILYAVVVRIPEHQANRKTRWVRSFRAPTGMDLDAIADAEATLAEQLPGWLADGVVPIEEVPEGDDTRPHQYGMRRWREMFSARQLLVHGTFVEEHRRIVAELVDALPNDQANDLAGLLGVVQGGALNYDSLLCSWHVPRANPRMPCWKGPVASWLPHVISCPVNDRG